jgi:hypothetical protein
LGFDVVDTGGSSELTLAASALSGVFRSIAAGDVNIHVITDTGLLVSDDRVALRGRYVPFCGHLRHLHHLRHRPHFYRGPWMPYAGGAATTLVAGEKKPIFVTVRIDSAVPPGRYDGAIELNAGDVTASLPLSIDVTPVVLREPPQLRMLWYLGTLDCRRPRHCVDEATFRAQLLDIRDHGFNAISLHETQRPLLRRACVIARAIGFSDVVLEAPYAEGLVPDDLVGLRLIGYVSDEPDRRGEAAVALHRQHMRAAGALGATTMTSLVQESFARRFTADDLGRRPDLVSLYFPRNRAYFRSHAAFPEFRQSSTLYYWLVNLPDPNVHRALAGLYLWKSQAAGISPYCYQHLPPYPGSPWDDDRDPDGELRQMVTYPASPGTAGSIPTLRWEALADGIADLRYVMTVVDLLAQVAWHDDADMRGLRDEVGAHLTAIGDACPLDEAASFASVAAHDFAATREVLTRDALALQRALAARTASVGAP